MFLNEHDKHAAAWLRQLIADGHLPPGVVDERDIQELNADDLAGHKHVHLFAGIGGWPLALRMAGWPDDREVWTGSCPCQPFSSAGKRKGSEDERHLWPVMFGLIRECRPGIVFGEQVASAIGHGWLDGVFADLEGEGYACGAVVLGAHSVGAPHIRQRLYWVADADSRGRREDGKYRIVDEVPKRTADERVQAAERGTSRGLAESAHVGHERSGTARRGRDGLADGGDIGGLGDAARTESTRFRCDGAGVLPEQEADRVGTSGAWTGRLILCRDGKHRRVPIEPALFPLAHGVPGRVGLLRGAGNAIVPQVAAEFVRAYMEIA